VSLPGLLKFNTLHGYRSPQFRGLDPHIVKWPLHKLEQDCSETVKAFDLWKKVIPMKRDWKLPNHLFTSNKWNLENVTLTGQGSIVTKNPLLPKQTLAYTSSLHLNQRGMSRTNFFSLFCLYIESRQRAIWFLLTTYCNGTFAHRSGIDITKKLE